MTEIKINHMAKVYGHAGLEVKTKGKIVEECKLNVFEGSRFFEHLIHGKRFDEPQRIASRICGICAASHNLTSIMAVENAIGVEVDEKVAQLREALILGGYIQSHSLHLYFLALPDYLGYGGILQIAENHPEKVERAFRLKKLGNDILKAIGGRPTHLITTGIGGFFSVPKKEELLVIRNSLEKGLEDAVATFKMFLEFKSPKFVREKPYGALYKNESYPILSGKPSIGQETFLASKFTKMVTLSDRNYSTSKFLEFNGSDYMTGPLARINTSNEFLMPKARSLFKSSGMNIPDFNSFDGNIARSIELVHAIEKCIQVIDSMNLKAIPKPIEYAKVLTKLKKNKNTGYAITEAPRGMLYHEYSIDKKGFIISSNIITPTAQNLSPIELDVREFLPSVLGKQKNKIITEIEKLIRSYDPCLSCATHFLDVKFI